MARPMFCIDFGSSFTKVGLRTDENAETKLIWHPDNTEAEEEDFCFASRVLADRRELVVRHRFGKESSYKNKLPAGMISRVNWKPELFTDCSTPIAAAKAGLKYLLTSEEFLRLARSYRVSGREITTLTTLYQTAASLFEADLVPAATPQSSATCLK